MPNIIITDYCNLNCSYCFANNKANTHMTLKNLKVALDFCAAGGSDVGIIGGEPTLHPNFKNVIKEINQYCIGTNTTALLYTNGIELEQYLGYLGDRIHLLINVNPPNEIGGTNFTKIVSTINRIDDLCWFGNRATCGITLHPNRQDYSFIWNIVDNHAIGSLRISVASPGGCYANLKENKEEYYNNMKPIFLKVCKEAQEHNCRLWLDCNRIPLCYFSDEEKELVFDVCNNLGETFCRPVIDITPDLQAFSCFGTRTEEGIDLTLFHDAAEIERFFLATNSFPKAMKNAIGRCETCAAHALMQCQGGCLSFAK